MRFKRGFQRVRAHVETKIALVVTMHEHEFYILKSILRTSDMTFHSAKEETLRKLF